MNNLFSFGAERKAAKTFSTSSFIRKGKTSVSFLAVFDVVIEKAVDSFKFYLQKCKDGEHYISEKNVKFQKLAHAPRARNTNSYSRIWIGGVIFHKKGNSIRSSFSKGCGSTSPSVLGSVYIKSPYFSGRTPGRTSH